MTLEAMLAVFESDLPPTLRLVLLTMADKCGGEDRNWEIWVSQATLSKRTGFDVRTIRRAQEQLEEREIIEYQGYSQKGTKLYRLNIKKLRLLRTESPPPRTESPDPPDRESALLRTESPPIPIDSSSTQEDSNMSPALQATEQARQRFEIRDAKQRKVSPPSTPSSKVIPADERTTLEQQILDVVFRATKITYGQRRQLRAPIVLMGENTQMSAQELADKFPHEIAEYLSFLKKRQEQVPLSVRRVIEKLTTHRRERDGLTYWAKSLSVNSVLAPLVGAGAPTIGSSRILGASDL